MATAKHGRKGLLYLDMSAGANSMASKVPMIVDWSIDSAVDYIDVTSCDSDNKEDVAGLKAYTGQFSANMDADSDQLYTAADGQARMHYFYPDRDAVAGKRRYNYGLIRLDVSESGGASAKLGQSANFRAAGSITRVFV
jgi:hypothetical protein